jgi:hypothetical protein
MTMVDGSDFRLCPGCDTHIRAGERACGDCEAPLCPECRQGKHANCTGWAFRKDDLVTCGCLEGHDA